MRSILNLGGVRAVVARGVVACGLVHYARLSRALIAAAVLAPGSLLAQSPPGTDIFLAELTFVDGRPVVGEPVNVTRRAGYDNQPAFTPDGRALLYTSIREDDQADIYRYDLASGETARVTRTAESEYSPVVTPDGAGVSVVRVEADGTQRLWRFDGVPGLAGTGAGAADAGVGADPASLVLRDVAPVGYYAWGDEHTLALFVLGDPPTLRLADARTGRAQVVAEGIGRSLHRVPGRRAVSFVRKLTDDEWWIERLELETGRTTRLVRALAPAEDYAWLPDGTLVMARGSTLYRWHGAGDWQPVADLSGAGLGTVTRLAVSPDGRRIALVAEPAG